MPGRHIVDIRDPTVAGDQRVQPGDAANRAIRVNLVAGSAGGGGGVVQQGARDSTAQAWWVRIAVNDTPTFVDPRDRTWTITEVVPISAASLPLPAGAATEATLASRLAEATFTARINTQGQKAMAASTPVVLASDQTVIPVSDNGGTLTVDAVDLDVRNLATGQDKVDARVRNAADSAFIEPATDRTTAAGPFATRLSDGSAFYDSTKTGQLPSALVGGRLDANTGAWLGSTAPTVGQKVMVSSIPVVIASDQSAVPVSGTVSVVEPVSVDDNGGSLTVDAVDLDIRNLATGQDKVDVRIRNAADSAFVEPATDRTTASGPFSTRLSDGTSFYDATKTGQLPTALVGGRLDTNVGAWLGSTAPTVGQKAMASSVPVVIASDQSSIPVTSKSALTAAAPAAASVGVASAQILAANASRKGLVLVNTSVNTISLGFGATAVLNSGITLLAAGGTFVMDEFTMSTAAVNAIASLAGSNISIQEYS